MSQDAETKLLDLLTSIFDDDVVTVSERESLLEFEAEGTLDPADVQRVFELFVLQKWGAALADGVVTEYERLTLLRLLEELEIPIESVPPSMRAELRRPR